MLKLPERDPKRVYLERMVIMALLLVPSAVLQGTRALLVAALSVLTCMITDGVWCLVRRLRYDIKDFAVPFWGLALALMMPVNISAGLVVLAGVLCISTGKHLFGASDNIIFCPPAISAAFLIICYPSHMLYFPRYGDKVAAFGKFAETLGRSIEYSLNLHSVPTQSIGDTLMGFVAGPIGAVYVGVILVCGVCMAFRRSNSGFVTLTCVLTAAGLAALFPRAEFSAGESVIYELSSGYFLFGTFFLAAEPHHAPKTTPGKLMYGFALGYTTMMFRFFGKTEGCFIFALLITNVLCAAFDRAVENFLYWKKTYLSTFESSKTQAQVGAPKLTDTQEILLPEKYRFNTPPIDGKITKKRRSKPEALKSEPKLTSLEPIIEDADIKIAPDYSRNYGDDAPNYELLAKIENIKTIVDYDEDVLETGEDGVSRIEQLRQQRQPGINNITEEENNNDDYDDK